MSIQYPHANGRNSEKSKITSSNECCHTTLICGNFAGIRIHAPRSLTYRDKAMQDDERCCGTGTCIIDTRGLCWCGQQWDGEKMCRPVANEPPRENFDPDLTTPAGNSDPD
jgi:hypothetical protein